MESTPREAVLYVNVRSRRGADWFERAAQALRDNGVRLREAQRFRNPRNLLLAVKNATRSAKDPMVVVGGGDGTLSAVVRCFVDTPSVFGVLPMGTGNAFARDLGLPSQPELAAEAIAKGVVREVDLGYAGNDYFVNVATVGLTAHIADGLRDEQKKRYGRAVYAFAVLKGLARVKAMHARLTADGEIFEFDTMQIVIGNGRFHAGPFPILPNASIDEGLLSVYAVQGNNKAALFRYAMNLPIGRHSDLPDVASWSLSKGSLTTTPSARIVIDGEQGMYTPIDFRVAPRAVRVAVPRP